MDLAFQPQLGKMDIEAIKKIDPHLAQKYRIIPLCWNGQKLQVAVSSAPHLETLDALRYALGVEIEPLLVSTQEMEQALERYHEVLSKVNVLDQNKDGQRQARLYPQEVEPPLAQMVQSILLEARKVGASDIHIEPMRERLRLRYRIDGFLHEMRDPPYLLHTAIINYLKIAANMSIAQKRLPQDGRMTLEISATQKMNIRLSTLPTVYGESMVLRLLDGTTPLFKLAQLGLYEENQIKIEQVLRGAAGMFLVTGPTGSGKSTTLYACLQQFNALEHKIITVEDPIEYQLEGINQVQVNETIQMTFAKALRSILRQAPNIIMIGEIRDRETASIAVQAAHTGHLVLSTLHTNDAPRAIVRMIDLGVPSFLLASCLRAILAQRLVRRLCEKCREVYSPVEKDFFLLRSLGLLSKPSQIYRIRGCKSCGEKGYKGRIGIFELLMINDSIGSFIHQNVKLDVLHQEVRSQGMRTVREDGIEKALAGVTTLEEVLAATCMEA